MKKRDKADLNADPEIMIKNCADKMADKLK